MKRSTLPWLNEGLVAFFVLLFLIPFPHTIIAASLSIESGGITKDGSLLLSVYVTTTQHAPINAAAATIPFALDGGVITRIDRSESIFDMWVKEPALLDNTVIFSGGTTGKGGFIFKGKLFDIYIDIFETSTGEFSFTNETIRAHDGDGTDIFGGSIGYSFESHIGIPSHFDINKDGDVSITELSIGLSS